MKAGFAIKGVVVLAALALLPLAQAQQMKSTPVDLSSFWNADGWMNDVDASGDTPTTGTNHASSPGSIWTLDNGDARVRVSSLPAGLKPGQVNVTEDGEVAFLLPPMNPFELDVYYAAGDTIPVPPGKYKYLYLACMSGNGNWPGSESDWAPITDIDTKEVLDQRTDLNCFTPIYQEGAGDPVPVGLVNDWFWKVPEWVAPTSGDPKEIIVDFLTYDGDPDQILYLLSESGMSNHDYGQYHYVNGAGNYFTYIIDTIPKGTKSATLWTEMWGNVKLSISNKSDADADLTVLYNSATEDQIYTAPAGNIDGYFPNRKLRSFDLTPYLNNGTVTAIYLKFEDAAPDNAAGQANNPWGARCRSLGIFTGPTKASSLGARLWPGLVRTDNNAPQGGLILIKKKYVLDDTKTLTSIKMPNNIPRGDPILSIFGMTLANEQTVPAGIYTHWNLGPDWVTGDGVYAIVDESATNKVLISAALDSTDPKHAWINKSFGTDYTVRCDVSMESWQEGADLSRAGIAAMIQPDGVGGGTATEDRGVNLLIHNTSATVQFLNDMEAWQDPATKFSWKLKTWYTFEMTVSGTKVSGKITEKAVPANTIDIPAWENYNGAAKRVGGFVGVTASTQPGLIAMYDNLQVLVNGEVKFSDDFQTPGDPMPAASGLGANWAIGEAGMYLVKNGVLYGVATTDVDPKHIWFNKELVKGGRIMGYCKMLSWENHDWSRSGLGIHIQPHGTGTGRQPSDTTPGEDRGLNLLFHDNLNRVQFLNDMRAWGPAVTFAWKTDTWYLFDLQSDGNQVSGSITNVSKPSDSVILAPWTYDKDQLRVNGYAGITASTRRGQIAAWDNIVIFDASGAKIFSDDFQGGTDVNEWSVY